MAAKKALILTVLLLLLGLFGCTGKPAANTLAGRVVLLPGRESPAERIKIWVFRFDSGTEPTLYPVDDKLNFFIPLTEDGEYSVEAVVEKDEGFSTAPVRFVMKNGKIVDNQRLELNFILTQLD